MNFLEKNGLKNESYLNFKSPIHRDENSVYFIYNL